MGPEEVARTPESRLTYEQVMVVQDFSIILDRILAYLKKMQNISLMKRIVAHVVLDGEIDILQESLAS
ncbi:hypothetical protein HK104_004596, partial [Borealophlyctis nickersoniae]